MALIRRSRILNLLLLTFVILILYNNLDALSATPFSPSPPPGPSTSTTDSPPPAFTLGRVFIASNHWNSGSILRSHWSEAVVDLITALGASNVYFSLYESGSWDDTKFLLRALDERLGELGVERSIILEETTHADEISRVPAEGEQGWVMTRRGRKELRRIPYLAKVRNRVLEPLKTINATFDRVLFLNDVIFTASDALALLSTRQGSYSATCSLDFFETTNFYDTFALRDSSGRPTASLSYPFFGPGPSRDALLRRVPVPVRSCWNGMVAFDATPFLPPQSVRFRGVTDTLAGYHVEGSECCLIHYDIRKSIGQRKGVWVNPEVRVAYREKGYALVDGGTTWPGTWDKAKGRVIGAVTGLLRLPWRNREIERRVGKWGGTEPGVDCLVDEMQVLIENGWKHL